MTVEWHEIEGYRVSFDVRLYHSRFIIVRDERPSWWRRALARWAGAAYGPSETVPVVVGRGLLEGFGDRYAAPVVLWDEAPVDIEVQTKVGSVMLARWCGMQARLMAKERRA
jgi:hypothetical protein